MKCFEMTHLYFVDSLEVFNEDTVPDWLSSVKTIKGSTMDSRWFYTEEVLTLPVGGVVNTDFRSIKRIV
ncbi:hypothetical protein S14_70 [Shewanella sp. phage 1/4]|uniref:hypothetical protein n=1 Tax=Shewanella phage 1/4 TaxID=1458859 RepID=UPI0004F76688|nr:hypothetical protein S14_70 [Shewanella sp. phage 1/4]AHK11182.1 hypothetical protein S14_70 [Shewanella sp. phage 1/4]